jgi:hypothetical protein
MAVDMVKARMFAWRTAGMGVMYATYPFYVVDRSFEALSRGISWVCMMAVVPNVILHEWCIKRHNALYVKYTDATDDPRDRPLTYRTKPYR